MGKTWEPAELLSAACASEPFTDKKVVDKLVFIAELRL
jgi:hypothetical protein